MQAELLLHMAPGKARCFRNHDRSDSPAIGLMGFGRSVEMSNLAVRKRMTRAMRVLSKERVDRL